VIGIRVMLKLLQCMWFTIYPIACLFYIVLILTCRLCNKMMMMLCSCNGTDNN